VAGSGESNWAMRLRAAASRGVGRRLRWRVSSATATARARV